MKINFIQYLQEQQEKNKITVLIISGYNKSHTNGYYDTTENIVKQCIKKDLKYQVLFPEYTYIDEINTHDDTIMLGNIKTNDKYEFDPQYTVAIVRGSTINTEQGRSLLLYLEQNGVFTINSQKAMELCSNKFSTYRILKENNIPTPRTFLISKLDSLDIAIKSIGNKFPVILKTLSGAEGIGVSIINDYTSLKGVLQTLWQYNDELIIQEYLKIDGDLRIIVLDGKVLASMKRMKLKGDFRSNVSLGAEAIKWKVSKEQEELAIKTTEKLGCYYCGVDMFDVNGKLYVVEVNTSPGSKGITKYSGINVIDELLQYISNPFNWKRSVYKEVGYKEKVTIEKIGKFDAKLDTGNGITSSIHADNIKVTGKVVSFEINGKKFRKELIKTVTVVKHQREIEDTRPIIMLNIQLGTYTLQDVKFALTNREGTLKELEPVLLGREVISKLRFTVNPDKEYTLNI
jgi:ribosomal protein S6--L-glutamate ligase